MNMYKETNKGRHAPRGACELKCRKLQIVQNLLRHAPRGACELKSPLAATFGNRAESRPAWGV